MNRAIIVTDLGYGDAGKGSMVDFLARQAKSALVVRYNGGPQAAHNVITPDGRHHTFAQFGSGSFVPGTRTHLSRFMLVNPFNLVREQEHLEGLGVFGLWDLLTIDAEALVITPWHVAANRIRELVRGDGRHGSCGQGIGETRFDSLHFPEEVIRVRDLLNPVILRRKLAWVQNLKQIQLAEIIPLLPNTEHTRRELQILQNAELVDTCVDFYSRFAELVTVVEAEKLNELMAGAELTLFEGAQAVLLDQDYGFHPYTTWSVTTQENALTLLTEAEYDGELTRLGVIRGYMVRHGPGPFVSEDDRLSKAVPDYHNGMNAWQQGFRVGHLDFVVLRYALEANLGVDELAVTNLDRMAAISGWQTVGAYELSERHRTSPYLTGVSDGIATGIRIGPKNRRDYQEAITNVLLASKPVLRPVAIGNLSKVAGIEAYLGLITQELALPVTYTSYGPTALEKKHLGS